MISVESISKFIEFNQLTNDIEGGTFQYDHIQWIEMRIAIENFIDRSNEMFNIMNALKDEILSQEFAKDVPCAKLMIDEHAHMKQRIFQIPIDDLDADGQHLLRKLSYSPSSLTGSSSCDSGYCNSRDSTNTNPDLQAAIPKVMRILEEIHMMRQQLVQLWHVKKVKLDQCLQLRMYEGDAQKMFDWIRKNRDLFLTNYTQIGRNSQEAKEIQDEHSHFSSAAMNVYVNINRLQQVASHLVENGHYSAATIQQIAGQLELSWKEFASSLDERSNILSLSITFHQRAEQYLNCVSTWTNACDVSTLIIPTDVTELEAMVHEHQALYEQIYQVYNDIHSNSKKLLFQLDHFIQMCHQFKLSDLKHTHAHSQYYSRNAGLNRPNPALDYQEGAKHVVSVIHQVLSHHRSIESLWHVKKIKLHQRLALALFQDDVRQVIEWIENHGEGFLRKNTGIGRNLSKAKTLQKSHEHFESVAQNTYTNAEKLLAAAEELAQTGECNAEEICGVAQELEAQITNYASRVERRRQLLNLGVMFFTHDKELTLWYDELKQEFQPEKIEAPESYEAAENAVEQLIHQRDSMFEAANSTIKEGETVLNELKNNTIAKPSCAVGAAVELDSGCNTSINAVEASMEKLNRIRAELEELWKQRKIGLDLCLQLRSFEREALNVSAQTDVWAEEIQRAQQKFSNPIDVSAAEKMLQMHSEKFSCLQQIIFDAIQKGQELTQVFMFIFENQYLLLYSFALMLRTEP